MSARSRPHITAIGAGGWGCFGFLKGRVKATYDGNVDASVEFKRAVRNEPMIEMAFVDGGK